MKKYKVKINCPGFKNPYYKTDAAGHINGDFGAWCDPEAFPEIFEEVKEPLFVTEDGKEIFENMFFYIVEEKMICLCSHDGLYPTDKFTFIATNETPCSKNIERLYFSTREAAEKYIELNKPMFSKKQFLDAIEKYKNRGLLEDYVYVTSIKKELGL